MSKTDEIRSELLAQRNKRLEVLAERDPDISAIDRVLKMYGDKTTTGSVSGSQTAQIGTTDSGESQSIAETFRKCLSEISGDFSAEELHKAMNLRLGSKMNNNTLHGQVHKAKEAGLIVVVRERQGRRPSIYRKTAT